MISSLRVQKREYLWNEEGCSGKESAILLCFEGPVRWAAIAFYFTGTLNDA